MNKRILGSLAVAFSAIVIGGVAFWHSPGAEAGNANSGPGTLNVVHGIPGAEVDVCARGEVTGGEFSKVLTDFNFQDIATLELPEGEYDAAVVMAGDECNEAIPGLSASGLFLPSGANVSVIAHLSEDPEEDDEQFKLTVGVNDTSGDDSGNDALLTVYHAANAPRVDIRAGQFHPVRELFTFVGNGEFGSHEIRPRTYMVAIVPAGQAPTEAVAEAELEVGEDSNTVVYAVGSLSDESFTLLTQVIPLDEKNDNNGDESGDDDGDEEEQEGDG